MSIASARANGDLVYPRFPWAACWNSNFFRSFFFSVDVAGVVGVDLWLAVTLVCVLRLSS